MQVAVDAKRTVLPSAGTVREVTKWENGRSTDVPELSPSGMPLFDVDVFVQEVNFGRPETKVYAVRVPAESAPEVAPGVVVPFTDLTLDVFVSKGNLRAMFRAGGIEQPTSRSGGRAAADAA